MSCLGIKPDNSICQNSRHQDRGEYENTRGN